MRRKSYSVRLKGSLHDESAKGWGSRSYPSRNCSAREAICDLLSGGATVERHRHKQVTEKTAGTGNKNALQTANKGRNADHLRPASSLCAKFRSLVTLRKKKTYPTKSYSSNHTRPIMIGGLSLEGNKGKESYCR